MILTAAVAIAAVVVVANRPSFIVTSPAANTSSTGGILTNGVAIVSKKPDLAVVGTGIQADGSTASAAQADLANKAAKLIARIKALPVADSDLNTTGYWIGPVYSPQGQTITGFRAQEQLQIKWHNVDTVGKALDAIVQEGGATNISISFTLNDPKPAEAEARSLAIGDARAKAAAMATAAGVRLGQVTRVSDQAVSSRPPVFDYASAGAATAPTQVPVGQLDVQVTVEVDFAIA
ncbi:MAG TPA: SIMPL domain-containing protein [Candidatus Limnocylindrales bacterium]|nr:SIMPL domain-containing protein [Candidatus Limnocylindrales bacterium]